MVRYHLHNFHNDHNYCSIFLRKSREEDENTLELLAVTNSLFSEELFHVEPPWGAVYLFPMAAIVIVRLGRAPHGELFFFKERLTSSPARLVFTRVTRLVRLCLLQGFILY
jgi:hypothetical protein